MSLKITGVINVDATLLMSLRLVIVYVRLNDVERVCSLYASSAF